MKYLDQLPDFLGPKLAGIGSPVFLRAHLQLTQDHGQIAGLAAEGGALAERLLGARADRVHVQGSVRQGYLSLLLECAQGQTALVSAELQRGADPGVWILIVGQHGTVRFDDLPEPPQVADPPAGSRDWLSKVTQGR